MFPFSPHPLQHLLFVFLFIVLFDSRHSDWYCLYFYLLYFFFFFFQEMVSFILSCLDRGLICSRMFQGGERLGESTECRGLFGVISLIFIFTVNGKSSVFACRTELRGWIFFSFLWLRCRSGVMILFAIFPVCLLPVVFVPPISRTTAGAPTLAFWGTHPIYFIFIFPC